MNTGFFVRVVFVLVALMLVGLPTLAADAPVVMDAYFRADVPFPEYDRYWSESAPKTSRILGGFLHVFVHNGGATPLKFSDVSLDDVSLTKAIAFSDQRKFRKFAFAASVHFSDISQEQKDKLAAAGNPVWFRFDPQEIAPGECGELTIRLRVKPASEQAKLVLEFQGGVKLEAAISSSRAAPRFEAITFSFGRDKAYLYLKQSSSGKCPNKIMMNGEDITERANIASEPAGTLVPVICSLKTPPRAGSLQCFQAEYPDGEKTAAAIRAWDEPFAYGMWGAAPSKGADAQLAANYLRDLARHGINVQMEQMGSEAIRAFLMSEEGRKLGDSLGIRRMVSDIGKGGTANAWAYFLMDEPDAGDARVQGVPAGTQIGSLGQGLAERSWELRQKDGATRQLLNIDMTFKPDNWYTYAQLPDILTADPYYQNRLAEAYERGPERVEVFKNAGFVYAVADICRSAQAPKQTDLVILTGRAGESKGEFRYATPQEKRIESYYALGAGMKGISYWWFHSLAKGLSGGGTDPLAVAQWREIGLVGAELRTIAPLTMTSCLADVPVRSSDKLWNRTLVRGHDTLVLVCVNNDYVNDRAGTTVKPIDDAQVEVDLPSWLVPYNVFDVSYTGTGDIQWDLSGRKLTLSLDKFDLTRLIVISSDSGMRDRIQKIYTDQVSANVAALTAQPGR